MKLDSVLTVAIGDLDSDGKHLSGDEWGDFRSDMRTVLDTYGTVVAETTGEGIGSDGDNEGDPELTAVYVVINVEDIDRCRAHVAHLLRPYGQSSACFAFDPAHEPCFAATKDGKRIQAVEMVRARIVVGDNGIATPVRY